MSLGHWPLSGAHSGSSSGRVLAFYYIIQGFLLSRDVLGCSPATHEAYVNRLTPLFSFLEAEGCTEIGQVQRYHIDKYLARLQAKKRSPHYVHSCFRAIRTLFNFCVLEEYISQSPMRNMKPPILPKVSKPFLSTEDRDRLLQVNPASTFLGSRNRAIIWTFWTSGLRLSELSHIKLSDLRWGQEGQIKVIGKGARERRAPFEPEAQRAILHYMNFRKGSELPELWLTEERRPLQKKGVTSALQKCGKRAGVKVKDVNHIFRRTWAWERIKEGVNLKYVMIAGGWATVDVLLGYVKAIENDEALKKIREARRSV